MNEKNSDVKSWQNMYLLFTGRMCSSYIVLVNKIWFIMHKKRDNICWNETALGRRKNIFVDLVKSFQA